GSLSRSSQNSVVAYIGSVKLCGFDSAAQSLIAVGHDSRGGTLRMYNLTRRSCGPAALALTGAVVSAALLLTPSDARACGCFAPPDPSVPIVQAGENIVFSHEDGVI